MTRTLPAAILLCLAQVAAAQTPASIHTTLYQDMRWRQVGPYRAGWATAVTGVPGSSSTFWFGGAGGGVWKSTDAGRTWHPWMQHETSAAIGALAIAPSDPKVLYAGTGQVAARYDIMAGDGVYRSEDGGETWRHIGLDSTRHIGALLVSPSDARHVLVAAMGHVFGPNAERGVYDTDDGGKTWRRTLFVSDSTGVVDLAWDPESTSVVYAAAWQMHMHPWLDYFQPYAGPESAVYRSNDGGEHWQKLGGSGWPAGTLGRIGLAVARGSGGRIVYAVVDAPEGGGGLYRSRDGGASWEYVNHDGSLGSSYFGRVVVAPDDSNTVYVMGRSIRRSTDGGKHFEVMRGSPGGDDYHSLWIDPVNPQRMITGSDQGAVLTLNGGATWSSWYNQPTGQFYHLAADDRFPYHIYSGQQDNGTVEIASSGPYGVIEERDWHPVGGDERDYMVPKPGNPDMVFGSGLGGHVSRFNEETRQSAEVSPWPVSSYGARPTTVRYRYTWITPLVFSPFVPHAMYLGSQVLFRSLDDGDHWSAASPDLSGKQEGATGCENPAPPAARDCGFGVIYAIAPSAASRRLIWAGTDDGLIHVTTDGGAHWRNVTPPSVPAWGRITTIDAAAKDTASAYVAVDTHRLDRFAPMLLRTHDLGRTWQPIDTGLPGDEYTTALRADPERRGLLYAGTNRGVYVSFDDGDHWQPLGPGFPTTWVRDLLVHQGDLLAATQGRGIWALDDLAPLREASATIARAPAHLFRPASAWRLRGNENRDTPPPPSTPLGQNPPAGAIIDYWIGQGASGPVTLTLRDSAGHVVRRFSSEGAAEELPSNRYFQKDWTVAPGRVSAEPGMHRFLWDLRYPTPMALRYDFSIAGVWKEGTPLEPRGPLVLPGNYRVTLTVGGKDQTRPLAVRMDPRVHVTAAALRQQLALAQAIDSLLQRAVGADHQIEAQLADSTALDSATAGSLRSLVQAGDTNLSRITGVLASLVTGVQSADAAPTEGQRAVYRDYRGQLEELLRRWAAIRQERGMKTE